jgi:primosomal protein N' (replication factor Y)
VRVTTSDQLELLALPPSPPPTTQPAATEEPGRETEPVLVARVAVDTPLPHLDRLFDYAVPAELDPQPVPGCRVKVRFAGRLTDGFVVGLGGASSHEGRLAPLAKVVSAEPVLSPEVLGLAREVADRWAGTLSDVLRLAVPPRQARVEARPSVPAPEDPLPDVDDEAWHLWPDGPDLLAALESGGAPRVVWEALPLRDPAVAVAEAVLATLRSGRGSVVCVPDARDLDHWDTVLGSVLGEGRHVVLSSAQKPAERYRAFLAVARGEVSVVLGTRAAAFAPVRRLGLLALWDDGDDLYVEPRAPYLHTREVLLTRAVREDTALLLAGYARTAEGQSLVASGWARSVRAEAVTRRRAWPRLAVTDGSVAGGAPARLPHEVFAAVRRADGPVLVQVPRRGYRTSLACQDCRTPARCTTCEGPLAQSGRDALPSCRWCGTADPRWTCRTCGSHRLRAPVVGQLRTAEEYAAAFPGREVVTSGGADVLAVAPEGDVLVLATPGAEPRVAGGYALVVLMDTWLALGRDDLRVLEEAHRRWFNALALARERADAVAVGDPALLQGLVRADPAGLAERELAERSEAHLPPVARVAVVEGPVADVAPLVDARWTPSTEVLGPVPTSTRPGEPVHERLVLRAPRREGPALAAALKDVQAARSAAKQPPLRVRVDPHAF